MPWHHWLHTAVYVQLTWLMSWSPAEGNTRWGEQACCGCHDNLIGDELWRGLWKTGSALIHMRKLHVVAVACTMKGVGVRKHVHGTSAHHLYAKNFMLNQTFPAPVQEHIWHRPTWCGLSGG